MVAVVLFGAPGAGKTTLGRMAAAHLELPFISSGAIARELATRDRNIQEELQRGEWASELAMRTEVMAQIEAAQVRVGDFVIEGFPRKLEQLYILESVPGVQPLYFSIELDPLICLRRLVTRHRPGDHPDAVATRFRAFQEYTAPVIEIVSEYCCLLDGGLPSVELVRLVADEYQREKFRAA